MTRLQYPVFSVDGWSGNTRDEHGVEWWVVSEDGWTDGPDVRYAPVERPQRDGAFDTQAYRSVRVIGLEGIAVAPDPTEAWRAKERLAALLADATELRELVVEEPTTPARRALVRLATGVKIAETGPTGFEFQLELTAPDPLRYSVLQHTSSTGPPRPGVGLTFPLVFPLRLGEPAGGRVRPSNAGTVPTAPAWTITGPVERPSIERADTGERLAFDLTLAEHQNLVIDTAQRTVRLDAASRRSSMLPGSRWFDLPSGETSVRFAARVFGEGARLQVHWRDAWM